VYAWDARWGSNTLPARPSRPRHAGSPRSTIALTAAQPTAEPPGRVRTAGNPTNPTDPPDATSPSPRKNTRRLIGVTSAPVSVMVDAPARCASWAAIARTGATGTVIVYVNGPVTATVRKSGAVPGA